MSAGRRSGVNWILRKERPRPAAKDFAISVFARPGTSSIRRCPSPRIAQSTRSRTGLLPTITASTASRRDPLTAATDARLPPSLHAREHVLELAGEAAPFAGPAHPGVSAVEVARAD